MATITLNCTGYLAEICPSFKAENVRTMHEAISAFSEFLRGKSRENFHQVLIEGFSTKDALDAEIGSDMETKLIPTFSGGSGVVRMIIGVILVVLAVVFQQYWFASYMLSMGLGLAIGGALEMLMKPKTPDLQSGGKSGDRQNLMSADGNTTKIGVRIPIIYGKRKWFGHVISADVDSIDSNKEFKYHSKKEAIYDGQIPIVSDYTPEPEPIEYIDDWYLYSSNPQSWKPATTDFVNTVTFQGADNDGFNLITCFQDFGYNYYTGQTPSYEHYLMRKQNFNWEWVLQGEILRYHNKPDQENGVRAVTKVHGNSMEDSFIPSSWLNDFQPTAAISRKYFITEQYSPTQVFELKDGSILALIWVKPPDEYWTAWGTAYLVRFKSRKDKTPIWVRTISSHYSSHSIIFDQSNWEIFYLRSSNNLLPPYQHEEGVSFGHSYYWMNRMTIDNEVLMSFRVDNWYTSSNNPGHETQTIARDLQASNVWGDLVISLPNGSSAYVYKLLSDGRTQPIKIINTGRIHNNPSNGKAACVFHGLFNPKGDKIVLANGVVLAKRRIPKP